MHQNPKKNDKTEWGWCSKTFVEVKREMIDTILKRQKHIEITFLKHKDVINEKEGPKFSDEMSKVFNLRNWKVVAFMPQSAANQKENPQQIKSIPC